MPKRLSRENARDRKASEDMSDDKGPKRRKLNPKSEDPPPENKPDTVLVINDDPPKRGRKRKLPSRGPSEESSISSYKKRPAKKAKKNEKEEVLWINDDTLAESDPDDSTYVTEESFIDDEPPVSINIHYHAPLPEEEEVEWGGEDRKAKDDGFMLYLLDKYVGKKEEEEPKSRKGKNKPPIKLNSSENKYFNGLKANQKKSLLEVMNRIAKMGLGNGEVPYKFKILELPIPDYNKAQIIKKINALDDMPADAGESYKLKNWIEGFLRVPFGKVTPLPVKYIDGRDKCTNFMTNAKKTMDLSIYGMQPAKLQIMQTIAQWIVNPDSVGNVIALKGPMGVGKTSFAKNAIAKVLNRPFEFFSLGGASDIANFVGHSYTYEGSMWGRIVDSLMHAGTMNPVFYFDELDKISNTPHGEEIVSMLIHLTDRSQNNQFHDRYFSGVEFDLSQCLFVFSLNDIEKVHPILRDRMTIINCDGYNEKDKKEILRDYVWPQLIDRLKFKQDEVCITDEGMKFLISEYSHDEKGVRGLIRTVETMMTRLNMLRIANDQSMKEYSFYMDVVFPIVIDERVIRTLLSDFSKKDIEAWVHMYT